MTAATGGWLENIELEFFHILFRAHMYLRTVMDDNTIQLERYINYEWPYDYEYDYAECMRLKMTVYRWDNHF